MGSFVGRFGSARQIAAIDYDDGTLEFRVPVQYEQNPDDLYFVGTLSRDRLEGTTVDSSGKKLTWSAVRAPSLERQHAPQWGEPLELWNGRDLEGWRPRSDEQPGCWSVVDSVLVATPPCVDLISERSFEDFRLHVEFKYPQGSNSGLYLRGRRISVELNGKTVVHNRVVPGITGGALDSNEGLPGPLMLQGDHDQISFRKITLTPAE